jgi:protein TonB
VLPVVKDARLVRQIDPEYPRNARREGIEGTVDLRFTVKADGKVADIEVVEATPGDTFDREAIAAVRRWRYEPRREDGVPVDSRTRVRLEFRLDERDRRR